MPYNPQIQDISGQLIAQGMSQASAARARAMENVGQSISGAITSGFKQYQQNQFLTKQAMGKFGGQLQDPNFKKYVDGVLAGDPNSPTVPEPLKKALQNAQKGQVDVYDAALLGNMVDAYQDNLKGQLLRAQVAQAEAAARPKPIPGQRMTFEQADAFRKANPGFNAKFIPAPGAPNEVILETLDTRAEPSPQPFQTVPLGGAAGVLGPTGDLRSVIQYVPPGAQATDVRALQQFAGAAPAAAAASAIPPGLSRFRDAAQAPAGPMAALGQFAGPPRAAAPAPAPAPAVTPAPAAQGLEFKPIPGSEQAAKAADARRLEQGKFQLAMESFDTQLNALERIIPNISGRTTGWGSLLQYAPGTKAKQMAADLAPIRAQEAFTGITQLKEAGGSLGQVAIYEVKLLENRRSAIDQATSPEDFKKRVLEFRDEVRKSKERMQILARDRAQGLDQPSEDYFKAGGYWPGVEPKAPNIHKLPIQRGSEPGTSTLGTSRPKFGPQYEGRVVINPQGQRVRIVNGQEVPIK
tara:strand:+ start:870 stop:2438 length:1569 start_codon:yes stop_codon:yes gene_type:complete